MAQDRGGANPTAQSMKRDNKQLVEAARGGDVANIATLISQGADVNGVRTAPTGTTERGRERKQHDTSAGGCGVKRDGHADHTPIHTPLPIILAPNYSFTHPFHDMMM